MKKIIILMPSMFIGGAERSLLGLLESIDYSNYDVSLFLYRHEGDFLKFIPEQVHVLPEVKQYRTFDTSIRSLVFGKQFPFGVRRLLSKIALKLHTKTSGEKAGVWMAMQYISRYLQPLLPDISGEYDLGIMFLGIADTLINKVNAKIKITWNHTDYDTLFSNREMDIETYLKVDRVISVSANCTLKFKAHYPELADKAATVENVLPQMHIAAMADERQTDIPDGEISLLSVGRFCEAKNFDNVPDICRRLIEDGLDVKWYLIGYGGGEALIRQKIDEAKMQDRVIVLGKKENPYPYIKACTLYVQPSRYEGKCVTVREAQLLKKPVVITNYATASSQLEDGVDGLVVPVDNEGCAKGIAALLRDPEKMRMLSENCSKRDYTNRAEIEKIYALMED